MALHINIEDLLSTRTVESDRIEYKEGWNPDAIYRSICAFANDFDNIGGGYIIIGVAENTETKTAVRPVKGLTTKVIGTIQQEMIRFNNLIRPYYAPKLFIEQVDGNDIIVLWVVAGNERPYEVPESVNAKLKNYKYFIRRYANSIEARGAEKEELISLSNNIPFDDRSNTQVNVDNISLVLVKDYLLKINSKLADQVGKQTDLEILGQMELISGPNEHIFPRNVALMLFSNNPEKYFPATQVEVVYFPNGEAEAFTEYDPIKGSVPSQIKRTLEFLTTNFLKEKVIKPAHKAESNRTWNYPLQAIEEILVNAFYHRDYQQREPIEIRIYPNSIVFINHGGPDRSIQLQAFNTGQVRSRRYRNRRLGEFLKELELTEGRATGIPTVLRALNDNGSPPPNFKSDDERTFFEVEICIHPAFLQLPAITINIAAIAATHEGINRVLDEILSQAGTIASTIATDTKMIDLQVINIVDRIGGTIASAIAGTIADKEIKLLQKAEKPVNRETLLADIGLKNIRKNYESYMLPLVALNWLTMTIPDKPTSPKQQYLTTLKGRLILEFLKHNAT